MWPSERCLKNHQGVSNPFRRVKFYFREKNMRQISLRLWKIASKHRKVSGNKNFMSWKYFAKGNLLLLHHLSLMSKPHNPSLMFKPHSWRLNPWSLHVRPNSKWSFWLYIYYLWILMKVINLNYRKRNVAYALSQIIKLWLEGTLWLLNQLQYMEYRLGLTPIVL